MEQIIRETFVICLLCGGGGGFLYLIFTFGLKVGLRGEGV